MNIFEKIYSMLAIVIEIGLVAALLCFPDLRQFERLLPLCFLGLLTNTGLLFVVLRDIFFRPFVNQNSKYLWTVVVLLFWPSIIYYLAEFGFQPRSQL